MCAERAGARRQRPARLAADVQSYATIVVVGGGCYGSYYVRQLRRAAVAGALSYRRVLVVDRDPGCRVVTETASPTAEALSARAKGIPPADVVIADWTAFFEGYFADAMATRTVHDADAIVPSPLMPHLMFEWLIARARERWPRRNIRTLPLEREPAIPWQRADGRGTHYVSFAEWTCPINCVEPVVCPATRGPRDWSMPPAVRSYVEAERERGRPLAGPAIFHCRHRAYGVGMFDTRDVLDADALVAQVGESGAARVLVATVSHCHGALSLIDVGA